MENKKRKKNKTLLLILIPVLMVIGVSAILSVYVFNETENLDEYFKGTKQTAVLTQVTDQQEVNDRLKNIADSTKYTLTNAYVELNPYEISPLSAIIIFQTKTKEEVEVYINNKLATTMEASKKHTIPIYGLYEDYDNIITLKTSTEEKDYTITTEKSDIAYPLEVLEKSEKINKENIYFTVASYETWLTGWDVEGKLRFYLTVDNRMDVEWLDNGHFLIGTSQGQFAENFVGFVEMDYLGKIYNYYTMENGYSFEFQALDNGNYLAAGGVRGIYITEQVVYEMDPKTGRTEKVVNLSKIFKDIDSSIPDMYLAQKAIRNGFYLDEKSREMVVSFRGIDTVFCIDYDKEELKWIFTAPTNELFTSSVWDKYKVESASGDYPWGQHSPQITSEGYIAFFNNGYDRYHGFENGGPDNVSHYANNYSRGEIYEIKDMKAKLVWVDDQDKKVFSHQYGSIRVDDEGNILIDYGYVLDDAYRKDSEATLSAAEQNPNNIHALIVEFDSDGNLIFKAKNEEGKYRAFKHTLYNETTAQVDVTELKMFDSVVEDELELKSYKDYDLEEVQEWINSINYTKNTFKTDYTLQEDDELKLLFMNDIGKIYSMTYKEKDNATLNRIFNANLPRGTYAMFIELNDQIFTTDRIFTY